MPLESFADYLFNEGEYDRAITEYYRLVYSQESSAPKADLLKKIGLCYFRKSDYEGYILFFKKRNGQIASNPAIQAEMNLCLAKSYYHLEKYQKAISTLEWSNNKADSLFFHQNRLLLAISCARLFEWEKAIEYLQLSAQDSSGNSPYQAMVRSLKNFPRLPRKKPVVAGILSSIIPGTGYVYSGRPGTGITSLLVNGLFIWAIRDAFVHNQYGIAGAALFLETGWYVGNIYGSVNAASEYNRTVRNHFIDKVLEREGLFEYQK